MLSVRNEEDVPVVVLVASIPRLSFLKSRALPSVQRQTRLPEAFVLVTDQRELVAQEVEQLASAVHPVQAHFLANTLKPGVAGAWNSGLRFIAEKWPDCYVAMLDDDDEWDACHIARCAEVARKSEWPDAVVSGLRICKDGEEIRREPPVAFHANDFLAGNPGWQGSNTFVRLQTLLRVGMFTEGLASSNDRDLAVRLLSDGSARLEFTGTHTATWHIDTGKPSLSSPGSASKSLGLAHFLVLHEHRMSSDILEQFYRRANQLFDLSQEDILKARGQLCHD